MHAACAGVAGVAPCDVSLIDRSCEKSSLLTGRCPAHVAACVPQRSEPRTLTPAFPSLVFTASVRAGQARYGGREHNERAAAREPDRASLSDEMQQRIGHAN